MKHEFKNGKGTKTTKGNGKQEKNKADTKKHQDPKETLKEAGEQPAVKKEDNKVETKEI